MIMPTMVPATPIDRPIAMKMRITASRGAPMVHRARRQARALQLVGKVRNMPVPSLATHTFASAQKLLTEHWTEMMSMDFDALLSGDGAVLDA